MSPVSVALYHGTCSAKATKQPSRQHELRSKHELLARPKFHNKPSNPRSAIRTSPRTEASCSDREAIASSETAKSWLESQSAKLGGQVAALALSLMVAADPASAADTAKIGTCLLSNCQTELARCLTDEKCVENLVCLNACAGRPDESDCQIRCGDLYADKAVMTFNSCAVTQKKCVPQIPDSGKYPVPPRENLVETFDTNFMEGRWYITAGLNRLFDTFDCQVHYFTIPSEGKLYGKLNWRVPKTNGQFYERKDIQTFYQDPENPAHLINNNNAFLNYEDNWYIVGAKADEYALVYYRGSNDAWDGYGGAVVYTKEATLSEENIALLKEDVKKVGLSWDQFMVTDNTCGPEPPLRLSRPTDLDTLGDDILEVEQAVVGEVLTLEGEAAKELGILEDDLVSFGRGFTVFKSQLQTAGRALTEEEQVLQKEAARELQVAERKLAALEAEFEREESAFVGFFKGLFGGRTNKPMV